MKKFSRFAWATIFYCLAVIIWGAYVRATGSGAGCGEHWPLCNGELIPRTPQMQTMIEFTHRLTSGLSLVLVIILGLWARRLFPRRHFVRKFANLSVVAILLEAAIGAGLVLLKLVEQDQSILRAISISLHLINTSFLMAVLTMTAFGATHPTPRALSKKPRLRRATQLFMGGFVLLGTAGALTALGDTLFQPTSLSAGFQEDWASGSHFLQRLRIIHPFLAISWGLMLIPHLQGLAQSHPSLKAQARLETRLVLSNLTLGAINILLLAPVWIQLVHLGLANLIWIGLVRISVSAASAEVLAPASDRLADSVLLAKGGLSS